MVDFNAFSGSLIKNIFTIKNNKEFNDTALLVFSYQYLHNLIYQKFCNLLHKNPGNVKHFTEIPFIPIEFFKTQKISTSGKKAEIIFTSSGTTGMQTSKHHVVNKSIYEKSMLRTFSMFFGNPSDYHILALLPSYLERKGSSLVYMVDKLIVESGSKHSGFYLDQLDVLKQKLICLSKSKKKTMLIGVSFALLDFVEKYSLNLPNLTVIETGGMKGRRKEIIREELHHIIRKGLGVKTVYSEYGMTELLSQAYLSENGIFQTPSWMKVLIRDPNDPLSFLEKNNTGGISVIDLANLHSCSFVATQDLGRYEEGGFSVLGRFDNSDIRGCNLLSNGI